MTALKKILVLMKQNPQGVRFKQLCQVCDFYFGNAKTYQVKQVLRAIEKMEHNNDPKK